jgi:MinD superfamily P-loop ATPase
MKEIVVISGKGGTGKTSITASFAVLGGKDVIVADCDVDAADMHLLLEPNYEISEEFYSGELAYINQYNCIQCGKCYDVCRFNAINVNNGRHTVDALNCEGCGYCARVCPSGAIINKPQKVGQCFTSILKTGSIMVHAKLGIGADNSGKLVAKVKNEAKEIACDELKEYVLVDGSPGVGCPVVSSLSGADFIVLVTEPSVSGIHDLERVYELVERFNIKTGCIINKFDINQGITNEIMDFLESKNIVHLKNIPYNEAFTEAMLLGKTIVELDNDPVKFQIMDTWIKIKKIVK